MWVSSPWAVGYNKTSFLKPCTYQPQYWNHWQVTCVALIISFQYKKNIGPWYLHVVTLICTIHGSIVAYPQQQRAQSVQPPPPSLTRPSSWTSGIQGGPACPGLFQRCFSSNIRCFKWHFSEFHLYWICCRLFVFSLLPQMYSQQASGLLLNL